MSPIHHPLLWLIAQIRRRQQIHPHVLDQYLQRCRAELMSGRQRPPQVDLHCHVKPR